MRKGYPNHGKDSVEAFQAAAKRAADEPFELYLYIAGTTPLSTAALSTVVALCEEQLAGRYELVVIDVYQEPSRAKDDQIIAVPTLLRKRPLPLRRLVGDLSDRAQLLVGLGLPPDAAAGNEETR